jgi:hypothetical protein
MKKLLVLNKLQWYMRLPVKWAVFALTVLAVCFPYPRLLIRHVQHWRDPNALIEPYAPAIQPLVEELGQRLSDDLAPHEALKRVERFVYDKIEYEWDWNTWGTADYLPTVTETIDMGKEDCDGQAVVAASLLRRFGFEAQLVTDFAHMWVKTDRGETMGPGKEKAIVATDRGLRFRLSGLKELPKAFAHGTAVFPVLREVIILGMLWLLLLRPKGGIFWGLAGLGCFIVALILLRNGGRNYYHPTLWMQWVGMGAVVTGFLVLLVGARRHAAAVDGVLARFPPDPTSENS